jgi:hypothetical protein
VCAAHVVVLDEDEPVGIILRLTELHITP